MRLVADGFLHLLRKEIRREPEELRKNIQKKQENDGFATG